MKLMSYRKIYCTYIHISHHGDYQSEQLPCCTFLKLLLTSWAWVNEIHSSGQWDFINSKYIRVFTIDINRKRLRIELDSLPYNGDAVVWTSRERRCCPERREGGGISLTLLVLILCSFCTWAFAISTDVYPNDLLKYSITLEEPCSVATEWHTVTYMHQQKQRRD